MDSAERYEGVLKFNDSIAPSSIEAPQESEALDSSNLHNGFRPRNCDQMQSARFERNRETRVENCLSTKTSHRKAHVDCSDLICDKALLAACLDAFSTRNNAFNDVLKGFWTSIFGAKSEEELISMTVIGRKQELSKHLSIDQVSTTKKFPRTTEQRQPDILQILDTVRREIESINTSTNTKIVQWENLPDWVVATTRCTFAEILQVSEKLKRQQQSKIAKDEDDSYEVSDGSTNAAIAYLHIFYVAATLLCLDHMDIKEISCSPLAVANFPPESSNVDIFMELLSGMVINPAVTIDIDNSTWSASKLSIISGVALLRVLTGSNGSHRARITPLVLERRGWGACDDNLSHISLILGLSENFGGDDQRNNCVRRLCQTKKRKRESDCFNSDHVAHMETNLDDISGENLAFAIELLLQNGAIDAWVTPIVMKKGRPAHTLHCLCDDKNSYDDWGSNETINSLLKLIFLHTSTLGIRIYRKIPRAKLDRSLASVATPFTDTSRNGLVDIKVSRFKNGHVVRKKAEFDHCREIAVEAGVAIKVVADEAMKVYDKQYGI